MIYPGAVARHGRLGITVQKNLVMSVQGYLYYGSGTGPIEPEEAKPRTMMGAIPTRHRSRFPDKDDVLRDDDEIMLFIKIFTKTHL